MFLGLHGRESKQQSLWPRDYLFQRGGKPKPNANTLRKWATNKLIQNENKSKKIYTHTLQGKNIFKLKTVWSYATPFPPCFWRSHKSRCRGILNSGTILLFSAALLSALLDGKSRIKGFIPTRLVLGMSKCWRIDHKDNHHEHFVAWYTVAGMQVGWIRTGWDYALQLNTRRGVSHTSQTAQDDQDDDLYDDQDNGLYDDGDDKSGQLKS